MRQRRDDVAMAIRARLHAVACQGAGVLGAEEDRLRVVVRESRAMRISGQSRMPPAAHARITRNDVAPPCVSLSARHGHIHRVPHREPHRASHHTPITCSIISCNHPPCRRPSRVPVTAPSCHPSFGCSPNAVISVCKNIVSPAYITSIYILSRIYGVMAQ